MVSLETRAKYLSEINANPKLLAFYNLLYLKAIKLPTSEISDTDSLYYRMIEAIVNHDKGDFDNHYLKISKRNPSRDLYSPFVHDDLLIFTILVGIVKFGIDRTWIQNVISIRGNSTITSSFEALAKENFQSKSDTPEMVISFLEILNKHILDNDYLNQAYLTIVNNQNLFDGRNDFETILSLRAYDLIVTSKQSEGGELAKLRRFESIFRSRIRIAAFVIYNSLLVIVVYLTIKYLRTYPNVKEYVDTIGLLIGLLGLSLANYFSAGRRILENCLLRLGGLHH